MPQSPPATIVHGDYRLGNTMFAPQLAGSPEGDLRLGDGDDRRPAGRPRLHGDDVDPARRPRRRSSTSIPSRGSRASRAASELIARYEKRSGRSMQRAQLVRDARAVEGDRVHGGQLQARARGIDRRSVSEDVRRRRDRDRRARAERVAAWPLNRLPRAARRLRRRADDRPVRLVPRLLRASRDSTRRRSRQSFREDPPAASC